MSKAYWVIDVHSIIINASKSQSCKQCQLCQQTSVVCFNRIQNNQRRIIDTLIALLAIKIKINYSSFSESKKCDHIL